MALIHDRKGVSISFRGQKILYSGKKLNITAKPEEMR